eukprot:6363547-Prorocentrum_lima.AAC.1
MRHEFPEPKGLIEHLLVPAHQAYWVDGAGDRHAISMATGVHQGCPFSMAIFSVIIGKLVVDV